MAAKDGSGNTGGPERLSWSIRVCGVFILLLVLSMMIALFVKGPPG